MKPTIVYGLEAQLEPSYLGGVTFAPASDAVLLAEPAIMPANFAHAGDRSMSAGSAGEVPQATPSGQHTTGFEVKVEMRGLGGTYANNLAGSPRDLHYLLLGSGHAGTFSGGVGSEKWTYVPESSGFDSLALRLFSRGQQMDATGVYCNMDFEFDAPGFLVFTFGCNGKMGNPADAALPAMGYIAGTVLPPKTENIGLTYNGVSGLVIRRAAFTSGRTITPRVDGNNAQGFAGFGAGRRAPRLSLTVEAEALSTIDPWALWRAATQGVLTFTVGSTQYNKMTFTAPQAQIIGVQEESDDPVGLWTLTFKLPCSDGQSDDDYSLVFD